MTDSEIKKLSENINSLKLKNKLTQKQLAQIGGVSVYAIKKLLSGQLTAAISVTVLLRLAKYFKLHISDLFNSEIK